MPIQVLDKSVCELIAAGEVVERPASVVKELVENAIDAGASAIEVELKRGGLELIRVTDNGSGIPADEAPTAFLRHATSKIRGADDLDGIATLGFRGEALAAICAVSRVKLVTRTAETDAAFLYRIEGGEECERGVAGAPAGTSIYVGDLFFNTPARMKFLKKDVHEGNAAQNIVEQLALSHPEIAFRLVREGKVAFSTTGRGGLASAAFCALPGEIASNLLEIQPADSRVRVSGLVCKPQFGRPSRSLQFVFVNDRFVKSRSICAAAEEAGRNLFMAGKHPAFILNVRLPLEEVDINVHPAKTEVRFKNEREVTGCVYAAVKLALSEFAAKPATPGNLPKQLPGSLGLGTQPPATGVAAEIRPADAAKPFYNEVSGREFREILDSFEGQSGAAKRYPSATSPRGIDVEVDAQPRLAQPVVPYASAPGRGAHTVPALSTPDGWTAHPQGSDDGSAPDVKAAAAAGGGKPLTGVDPDNIEWPDCRAFAPFGGGAAAESDGKPAAPDAAPSAPGCASSPEDDASLSKPGRLDVRAKLGSDRREADRGERGVSNASAPGHDPEQTALEAETENGAPALRFVGEVLETYIIAQCGDEVLLIDKHAAHERILFEKLKESETGCARQVLLEPVIACVSRDEKTAVLENAAALERVGFVVDEFGDRELAVREIPTYMTLAGAADAVVQMAAQLCAMSNDLTTDDREWLLHSSACRAAIKAGHKSSAVELVRLAQDILNSRVPKFCPHGRPVYVTLTKKEIEKQFGRA